MSRNETDIKVAGQWKHLYRAADGDGHTIDFLLRAKRDCAAARCFLPRAIDLHGAPKKITIDKGGANTVAIKSIQTDSGAVIEMRQISGSTTSSSWIIGPSNASCDPCCGSRPFAALAHPLRASRQRTRSTNVNSMPPKAKSRPQPASSTR